MNFFNESEIIFFFKRMKKIFTLWQFFVLNYIFIENFCDEFITVKISWLLRNIYFMTESLIYAMFTFNLIKDNKFVAKLSNQWQFYYSFRSVDHFQYFCFIIISIRLSFHWISISIEILGNFFVHFMRDLENIKIFVMIKSSIYS